MRTNPLVQDVELERDCLGGCARQTGVENGERAHQLFEMALDLYAGHAAAVIS